MDNCKDLRMSKETVLKATREMEKILYLQRNKNQIDNKLIIRNINC